MNTLRAITRRSASLPELALICTVLFFAVVGARGMLDHVVDEAKAHQTAELLDNLNAAMDQYYAANKTYPHSVDFRAAPIVTEMLHVEQCKELLAHSPAPLIGKDNASPYCRDAWGNPIRYIPSKTVIPQFTGRIQLTGGKPIFESAGPDGDFGDDTIGSQSDNIRGDDL